MVPSDLFAFADRMSKARRRRCHRAVWSRVHTLMDSVFPDPGRPCRRQRSEHQRTSSQTSFHFFLHWNGRPQQGQILVGRWAW
jgi:hypothetical protein